MRAEVGVISRSIRIIGKKYDNIDEEAFGARVLVSFQSELTDDFEVRTTLGTGWTFPCEDHSDIRFSDGNRIIMNMVKILLIQIYGVYFYS